MTTTPYLTLSEFRSRSVMPGAVVDALEAAQPGWVLVQLGQWSGWQDMYLGKRYAVPFTAPYPEPVKGWLTHIVTREAYKLRGVDPADEQMRTIVEAGDRAEAEVKLAADGQLGLIEFSDADKRSRVTRGGPRVYSESSPYVGGDVRRGSARGEDRNRRGT